MKNTRELTILQINDTHGYLEEHQEMFWEGERAPYRIAGGYARIASVFKRVRQERRDAVIALDNGDTLHGTYVAVHSQGESLVDPLNLLALDGWTFHWDIAYGQARLHELAARLSYPLLAANCRVERTGGLKFSPSVVLERGGIRVAVIGLAAFIIDKSFPENWSEGLRFTLGKEELPRHITQLREEKGAEVIVVLSHLGFPQDCQLAADVSGIDVILSGHTHNRMYEPVVINGSTIIQSGCHGSFVGRLDIAVQDGRVQTKGHELIALDDRIKPDPEMEALVNQIVAPHRRMLGEVVGETSTALNRYTSLESTMDNFLLDAISDATGTQIAFSNGWRYGAPIPPGAVRMSDLWNMIPTNPNIELVDLTGAEIGEMFEDNFDKTFARDPYRQMGGYVKRCRGVSIRFKVENPVGSRIQEFFVGDERLRRDTIYTAAFVTDQGVPKKYGMNRRDTGVSAVEALRRYLAKHTSVNAGLRGTIIAV
jgi:S-sulfosulfanyl-L-cysteine sulfohydrolase